MGRKNWHENENGSFAKTAAVFLISSQEARGLFAATLPSNSRARATRTKEVTGNNGTVPRDASSG